MVKFNVNRRCACAGVRGRLARLPARTGGSSRRGRAATRGGRGKTCVARAAVVPLSRRSRTTVAPLTWQHFSGAVVLKLAPRYNRATLAPLPSVASISRRPELSTPLRL
ncbi:unnamed protein product [Arctia plantaginis]|uniref:Uncharacterized protein n=1 Tax=Arctia plantaginis TaxID=874455 RepID=A0A8S0ZW33_ARCPL|nr:unnamed protein product [Arctia plantaginis]